VIYVDSGSTDESVPIARSFNVPVVALDPGQPFTAARARNEGFARLLELQPALQYVMFVDGDCEVIANWPGLATAFLAQHPQLALVCGRRREKYPARSIYNRLCDMEWGHGPSGEILECGGDALITVRSFRQMQGYRPELICGEEPELCVRLRQAGWHLWRLEEPMTIHDAAMDHFSQWWRRMQRGGYAFAQGARLQASSRNRFWRKEASRCRVWGLYIPVLVLAAAALFGPAAWSLLLIYPVQIARVALRGHRTPADNWLYAVAVVLGKFPEMLGQLRFVLHSRARIQTRLIEYK
jgi:glycosyltransferase involved in cell wall biosynthesis